MKKKLKNAVMHIAFTSMIGMAFLEVIDHAMVYREWAAEKQSDEGQSGATSNAKPEPEPEPAPAPIHRLLAQNCRQRTDSAWLEGAICRVCEST